MDRRKLRGDYAGGARFSDPRTILEKAWVYLKPGLLSHIGVYGCGSKYSSWFFTILFGGVSFIYTILLASACSWVFNPVANRISQEEYVDFPKLFWMGSNTG